MATIQITETGYLIDGSSNTYIVAEDVKLTNDDNGPDIEQTQSSDDNTVEIYGWVTGARLLGAGTQLYVGDTGTAYGVDLRQGTFTNDGTVGKQVNLYDNATLIHHGSINRIVTDSSILLDLSADSVVKQIDRTDAELGETTYTVNNGFVGGSQDAFTGGNADDTFVNKGTIHGSFDMGGGNDVFESRDGIVTTSVSGGDGDDKFYLSNQIKVFGGDGKDTVYSTVSFALAVNSYVQTLELLGEANLDATGDNGNNTINGNAGRNRLTGGDGNDTLAGFGGRDLLFGGTGGDNFVFNRGFGHDVVKDFAGRDQIDLSEVAGLDGFRDLMDHHVRFERGGAMITIGGASLFVEDVSHFDKADFIF